MTSPCCGFLAQYTHHHLVAFLLTFFSYVLLHASRKTFSNVKVSISAQWTPSVQNASLPAFSPRKTWEDNKLFADSDEATLFLGALDTIFLFSYAVGLYVSGVIGDRMNLRYVLTFGLCGSAIVEFVFGTLTEWLQFYNIYLYCSLWVLNGLMQSAVWPCVVAVMGNWFGKSGRGFVFGLWSACASVGNILGAFLASSVLKYGYEYAFLVTSVVQFAGGVVVFFGLLTSPKEVGLCLENETGLSPVETDTDSHRPLMSDEEEEDEEGSEEACDGGYYSIQQGSVEPEETPKAIGFCQAFSLPGVLPELWLEGGRGRQVVCMVRRGRHHRWYDPGLDLRLHGEKGSSPVRQSTSCYVFPGWVQPLPCRPGGERRSPGRNGFLHRRAIQHDQLGHLRRPGTTGGPQGKSGGFGYCHRDSGRDREHRSRCRTVFGIPDREQTRLDVCVLLLHSHDRGQHTLHM
ncbi:sugar phosphate exchanger 3 isoform X4 [Esox lucius]|uniref:sugar phosphate exchanger 3 isoform X4 n=1 Tax=Esox lucius TaxID=8010 RepID=UPI001476F51A|nr:sugar phosphate exchanger 3 isoform X4 [Esox lucius]